MFEVIAFIALTIAALVIGVYLLFLPAIIAERKGSSFWGFFLKRMTPMGFNSTSEFAPTCYMIAISCLNTRGCNVVRSEPLKGVKNLRSNNVQHYDIDATEYITAIRSGGSDTGKRREVSGTRRSPIPHLRRGHERITNGKRTWVRDMLINVKAEGDIAFVDKRIAYALK